MSNVKQEPIDKRAWGLGPWATEPDRVEFESEGFPCLIVRHEASGHLCGYVAVPPGHPWHGKTESYSWDDDGNAIDGGLDVRVHGGVSYAAFCDGNVCHVPKPGEPDDVWWIGFDMGHCDDLSPLMHSQKWFANIPTVVYRTIQYVRAECESVARQAKAAMPVDKDKWISGGPWCVVSS